MIKYILIETEYDVVCRTVVCDTLAEAQDKLKQWIKVIKKAMPHTSIWNDEDMTYAHAKTFPYSAGPWAQIVKIDVSTQLSTLKAEC